MNIPCPEKVTPCIEGPLANLSAEGPELCIEPGLTIINSEDEDVVLFFGRRITIVDPILGTNWLSDRFAGFCSSTESQEAADQCAGVQALECLFAQVFLNEEASCTVQCPDGSDFIFLVEAGKFSALTQEDANSIAASYACRQALIQRLCLSDLNTSCCTGTPFSASIFAS